MPSMLASRCSFLLSGRRSPAPRTIPTAPSSSWCRSPPAARPTPSRACSPRRWAACSARPLVIENRAGAGGLTGTASVAKAEPDGYTHRHRGLERARDQRQPAREHALPSAQGPPPGHPDRSVPEILVVNEDVPAKTLAELVALAKSAARQARVCLDRARRHAAPGHGAAQAHRPDRAGARALYGGGAGRERPARRPRPAVFADIPVLLGGIQSGKLRALAIGSRVRSPSLPACRPPPSSACPQVEATTGTAWWSPRPRPRPRRQAAGRRRRGPALGRGQGQVSAARAPSPSATPSASSPPT